MTPAPQAPVVLVTGGSRGIGAAVVERCVEEGVSVCFTYRSDEASALELAGRVGNASRVLAVRADVTDPRAMDRAFDAAEAMGRLTGLVNNAAVTGRLGAFVDVPPDEARTVLEVNLLAVISTCQAAVRRWSTDPAGRSIVNVSSIAASLGAPGEYIPYAASKAGVEALTVGLAKEIASTGIRVNAVAPGTADTGIHAAAGDPGRPLRVVPRIPVGRIADPREIAEAVVWLLSPRASYVTGAVLRAAGGL